MIDVHPDAKALIFDLDGTLVDSMPYHFQAWNQVFNDLCGLNYPLDLFKELAGMPTYEIIPIINKRLNVSLDPAEFDKQKEKLFSQMLNHIKPIKEVVAIVHKFHNKLPIAVGTGGRKDIVNLTLKVAKLDKYFDIVITADDVEKHKPHPETFLKCAKLMNVEPANCQVFEDSPLGIKAAIDAGMIATLV